ncbi:hypothetical protein C8Q77DRAFT_1153153 [Trametes polyzona]|nr:hypothetical protein C8Q77DRAFT_1153153 [Trametes polyzona]
MQYRTLFFTTFALGIAALGVQAASDSSAQASSTASNASTTSSAAPTGNSTSSGTTPSATNKTNHALRGASIEGTLLFEAAAVLGGTVLGAVVAL